MRMERPGRSNSGFRVAGVAVALGIGLVLVATASAQKDAAAERPFTPRILMKPRRPIVNASFIAADKVTDQVSGSELVLGVVVEGQARAYPINMLTGPSREIINDRIGKTYFAATW